MRYLQSEETLGQRGAEMAQKGARSANTSTFCPALALSFACWPLDASGISPFHVGFRRQLLRDKDKG
jgi:hypothetical protein